MNRRGLTLVELLVVAIIGTLLLLAAYQVLVTNRRVFTVQNSRVNVQQVTRSAMDVLFAELREVSSMGSDVVAMGPDSLAVRAMRKIGAVCDPMNATHSATPQLLVRKTVDDFAAEDSVYVFADNDEFATDDDEWFRARVTAIDTTALCTDGAEAQLLTFAGQTGTFTADSVSGGAPIRTFVHMTYRLGTFQGAPYLGRSVAGAAWVPIMGPLATSGGLDFEFLDGTGATAATPGDVRQIDVTLRAASPVRMPDGTPVVDSLSSRIYLRN